MARGQILFDHLWGIPGGGGNDPALLRSLRPQTSAAPFVVLDQRDIAENRDGCCNHSLGRAAREYAWHSQGLHGLKYTVFDRERLPARVCWGVLVLALFVAAVCVSASASRFLLSQPSVYVAVDKVRWTNLEIHPHLRLKVHENHTQSKHTSSFPRLACPATRSPSPR